MINEYILRAQGKIEGHEISTVIEINANGWNEAYEKGRIEVNSNSLFKSMKDRVIVLYAKVREIV